MIRIGSNKPYRQIGSNPHGYWVRAYFTSKLEIKGEVAENDRITVDVRDGELVFDVM